MNAFTSGVTNNRIRDKLVRSFPDSLADAIKLANEEKQILDRVEMFRMQSGNFAQFQPGNAGQSQQAIRVGQLDNPRYEEPMDCNVVQRNKFTEDGKPICNFCNKVGHMYKTCWARKRNGGQGAQYSQNQGGKLQKSGQRDSGNGGQHSGAGTGKVMMERAEGQDSFSSGINGNEQTPPSLNG